MKGHSQQRVKCIQGSVSGEVTRDNVCFKVDSVKDGCCGPVIYSVLYLLCSISFYLFLNRFLEVILELLVSFKECPVSMSNDGL